MPRVGSEATGGGKSARKVGGAKGPPPPCTPRMGCIPGRRLFWEAPGTGMVHDSLQCSAFCPSRSFFYREKNGRRDEPL